MYAVDIVRQQRANVAVGHYHLVEILEIGVTFLRAIVLAHPRDIFLRAIDPDNTAPGLVIVRQHTTSRRPADGFDQQVFRLFMDDSDADALGFLDPVVTVIHPVLRVGDFLGEWGDPLQNLFGVRMPRLHRFHVGDEFVHCIS